MASRRKGESALGADGVSVLKDRKLRVECVLFKEINIKSIEGEYNRETCEY